MKSFFQVAFLLLALPAFLIASPEEDVEAATQTWSSTYNSRDRDQLLALYAPDAVFWGTGSQILRDEPAEVAAYFKGMENSPDKRNVILDHRVRVYGDVAISTGFYTFYNTRDGVENGFAARFSFVFNKQADGSWLLVDHHSSAVPAK